MMSSAPDETVNYVISVDDFDKSLLPTHARTPGTDVFREEVSRIITADFRDFGGRARIVVDNQFIRVEYSRDLNQPDLLDVAVQKLTEGNYQEGILLLRFLLSDQPDHCDILYNLGMALSDMGTQDEAECHLRHALEVDSSHVNSRVAIGIVLARKGCTDDAVKELCQAVKQDPDNPYANRNLGACLFKTGKSREALEYLRRATELKPDDQQAWFGLAQALDTTGDQKAADDAMIRVIDIDPRGDMAETARQQRTQYAHQAFREKAGGAPRIDAVMYMLGAIQKFEKMSPAQIKQVGAEIAILGQRGIDMNNPAEKYHLRSLPGSFSGLHLVCLMYAAFKIIALDLDSGIDLSKEYEAAKAMHRKN